MFTATASRPHEYYLCLDTETTNDFDCPLVYDVGGAIVRDDGKVLNPFSFAVDEIFNDARLMSTAYFAKKLPAYHRDIAEGKREIRQLYEIRKHIADLVRRYHVRYAVAHNARFDNGSLNTTIRYRSTSMVRFFLPYGVKWVDTLKMARMVFKGSNEYNTFCRENGYVCKNGQNRFTAEVLYRFLSGNNEFIEEHQGLADVLIEKDILVYCLQYITIEDGLLWSN